MIDAAPPFFELAPAEVADLLTRGAVDLLDVREPYERAAGYIPSSRHVELSQLAAAARSLDPARPVVCQCRVGARSAMATQALRRAGYEAYNLGGGILGWAAAGLPLEPEGAYVADH